MARDTSGYLRIHYVREKLRGIPKLTHLRTLWRHNKGNPVETTVRKDGFLRVGVISATLPKNVFDVNGDPGRYHSGTMGSF